MVKFSNGQWLARDGMTIYSPRRLHQASVEDGGLTLYVSHNPSQSRGATLGGPLFTIRLGSPIEGVIRVRVEHFRGGNALGPEFSMADDAVATSIDDDASCIALKSGSLSARISKEQPWRMSFFDGERFLTESACGAMAYIVEDGGQSFLREQLGLGVGESVYGLGERFTAFVKNGQTVDSWNEDGGTNTEQSYKNIPFYLTSRGYGVLVNHPERVSFEVGSEKVSAVQFSVEAEALEYYVINGPSPKEILQRYTALTGRPALPPAWSFGLWLTTSFTTDYDEKTAVSFIDGMADRQIPLSVFHFDCFWMKEYEWCNFTWDERAYPDPEGMLQRLHARGLKLSVWINPYIGQRAALFDEARDLGYLLKRPDGRVWQWDLWQPGMGIIDFTNPEAKRWFQSKLKGLIAMGVDAFKTDFGERIPLDVQYADGSDPSKMHNYYPYLYNQAVFEALQQGRPQEAVVFARSATVGGQKFPVHWGGDCHASYASMAESLRGGLSLGLSGFGFWSHDIGGFEGTPTADLYKRWIQFGLLSTHSRLHGNSSYRVPWLFDQEAVDVLRYFAQLKNRLMPYLYQKAVEAQQWGHPVMRAMHFEFPQDRGSDGLDRQYMLGDALLVAPVFSEEGEVDFYLPEGQWTHLLNGEVLSGGGWRKGRFDYFSLPLFVRPNAILAMGSISERPDYAFDQDVALHIFSLDEGRAAETRVPNLEGTTVLKARVEYRNQHMSVVVEQIGPTKSRWSLCFHGMSAMPLALQGADAEVGQEGLWLTPSLGSSGITFRLPA